jgi:hypothetical protein
MGDTMRIIALAAAAALLTTGTAALAAPASVSVTVGPELQKKAVKKYGVKDVNRLADNLRSDVERELVKTGALDGARVELVLVDATPNRPTMKQMGDNPGLSYQSFGLGGARIQGQVTAADGTVSPLKYRWYETDIGRTWYQGTWADAEWTFDRFATKLSRGQAFASR